jgi:hypothetical protein
MKRWFIVPVLLLPVAFAFALQNPTQKLIELDKKWGEANIKGDKATIDGLLADDLMSLSPQGVGGKAQVMDITASPDVTSYNADEYKVMMLGDDAAVMIHRFGAGTEEAFRSLHVWAKKGGTWKVVATSGVPVEGEASSEE